MSVLVDDVETLVHFIDVDLDSQQVIMPPLPSWYIVVSAVVVNEIVCRVHASSSAALFQEHGRVVWIDVRLLLECCRLAISRSRVRFQLPTVLTSTARASCLQTCASVTEQYNLATIYPPTG